ncbi:MAG: glucose-1-phosphate adenylyltransferase [Candidatus Competibacteraceae bacterium]
MEIKTDSRFVSRLTRRTLALILAGGRGSRLYELTDWRAKPGVPFGGKFRIIDFPMSNCVNSDIRRIGVVTQYKAHSLIRHLIRGWSSFRAELGEFMEILPASQRVGEEWYSGTADAIYQNLDIINAHDPEYVLVLSGDHIYKMDYGNMLAFHVAQGADMTVSCLEVPIDEARGAFGVMTVDQGNRVLRFDEKPQNPAPIPGQPDMTLASMGNYIFSTEFLYEQLRKDAQNPDSKHDFGMDIIPSIIRDYKVFAYPFRDPNTGKRGYWRDVGTVDAFWKAHMELVDVNPELDLYDKDWPILTAQPQLPPAKFIVSDGEQPSAVDSMVSSGCVIAGAHLWCSLLFFNVIVNAHTRLEESVLLPEVEIGRNCRIRKAIIDKSCIIPDGTVIGEDPEEDAKRFRVSSQGVVLVTRDMLQQRPKYYAPA